MEIATEFEKDWTIWNVAIVGVLTVAALVWAGIAVPVGEASSSSGTYVGRYARPRWLGILGWIIWFAASIAAVLVLVIVPGAIMRHLPVHAMVWWVALGCALAVLGLFMWGSRRDAEPLEVWIPAGAIGVGFVFGWIGDALTRWASTWVIPLGSGVVLVLVIVLFVVFSDRR